MVCYALTTGVVTTERFDVVGRVVARLDPLAAARPMEYEILPGLVDKSAQMVVLGAAGSLGWGSSGVTVTRIQS